jgi:uncharacterized protein (TIGR03000 family)
MMRFICGAAAAIAFFSLSSAQAFPPGPASGLHSAPNPALYSGPVPYHAGSPGMTGGFGSARGYRFPRTRPGYPLYGGYGGFDYYPYDDGYSPYFGGPGPDDFLPPLPSPGVFLPPQREIVLANEFPAELTLQLPAPAKVWLDGKEVKGSEAMERVVKSPELKPGQQYTFKLRARWEMKGKTYEYNREVTLGSGAHSRVIVLTGAIVDPDGSEALIQSASDP